MATLNQYSLYSQQLNCNVNEVDKIQKMVENSTYEDFYEFVSSKYPTDKEIVVKSDTSSSSVKIAMEDDTIVLDFFKGEMISETVTLYK